jgi:hypothetical protein
MFSFRPFAQRRSVDRNASVGRRGPRCALLGAVRLRYLLVTPALVAIAAVPAEAATYTVTNVSDVNAGSLRRAIEAAEAQPGHDTIKFDIPGTGAHKITLVAKLPILSEPVTIKGYSQPGSVQATSTSPAEPTIEIDAGAAGRGLEIGGDGSEVRGLAIHSAQYENVMIEGHEIAFAGNHVGTNRTGDEAADDARQCNVLMYGEDNLVGGPRPADRNVIAGRQLEICVLDRRNEIANNRIGTSADGRTDLGYGDGVLLTQEAPETLVRDNLISGLGIGVEVLGDHNTLQGNRVGTNVDGAAALPNGVGINVEGGDHNTIGGTSHGEGNLISGNAYEGLQLETGDDAPDEEIGPAVGNQVLGNLIGTDVNGTAPLGNGSTYGLQGIVLAGANDSTIGGHEPGAGNVIAANTGDGIDINGDDNQIFGNTIGTNATGDLGLGNSGNGIHIVAGDRNRIGDAFGTSMNTIAYNVQDGVLIEGPTAENTVIRNLIFANGTGADDLGIDLAADGVTDNDREDADTGPNDLLNYPLVRSADAAAGTIAWSLRGLPDTGYRLEFYASPVCNASGTGEGQRYLGAVNVNTDGDGEAAGVTPTATAPAAGDHVTLTATRRTVAGPLPGPLSAELHETSEFSPCEVAS